MKTTSGLPGSKSGICQHSEPVVPGSKTVVPRTRKTSYRPALPHQRECPVCGRRFAGRPNRVYCSATCRRRARYLRSHPEPAQYAHECAYCGLGFISKRKEARFCCDSHRVLFQRRERARLVAQTSRQMRLDVSLIEDYADKHGVRSLRALAAAAQEVGR
jgi:hypothetical protein